LVSLLEMLARLALEAGNAQSLDSTRNY